MAAIEPVAVLQRIYRRRDGLAIWCFLIFNPLENVLRPYLISRGSSLPILLILLGMLGGLAALGLLGIFVGPTVLAVGYSLVLEWVEPVPRSSE